MVSTIRIFTFSTVLQRPVLEEALLCNERHIKIAMLSMCEHGQFWLLRKKRDKSANHYVMGQIFELPLEQLCFFI